MRFWNVWLWLNFCGFLVGYRYWPFQREQSIRNLIKRFPFEKTNRDIYKFKREIYEPYFYQLRCKSICSGVFYQPNPRATHCTRRESIYPSVRIIHAPDSAAGHGASVRAFQGISSSARRHLLKYALRWSAVIPMICTYINVSIRQRAYEWMSECLQLHYLGRPGASRASDS